MRVQLALNVENLEEAIEYYTRLFGVGPNKRKPGYANFAIDRPALKLVLFEAPGAAARLNHLGVEVFEQEDVDRAVTRLSEGGIADEIETAETCCFATQNKVWSSDPQGLRWEWYRVLADAEEFDRPSTASENGEKETACCAPAEPVETVQPSCCAPEPTIEVAPTSCCGPTASASNEGGRERDQSVEERSATTLTK